MNVGDEITVHMPVYAEYSVTVKVTEDMMGEDDDSTMDNVLDAAYEDLPAGLCHGCSTGNTGVGWGTPSPVYLELGDNPEAKYAIDNDGNTVWGDPEKPLGW